VNFGDAKVAVDYLKGSSGSTAGLINGLTALLSRANIPGAPNHQVVRYIENTRAQLLQKVSREQKLPFKGLPQAGPKRVFSRQVRSLLAQLKADMRKGNLFDAGEIIEVISYAISAQEKVSVAKALEDLAAASAKIPAKDSIEAKKTRARLIIRLYETASGFYASANSLANSRRAANEMRKARRWLEDMDLM
jgi:hypothetical protein